MLNLIIPVAAGLMATVAQDTLQGVTFTADRGVTVSRTDTVKVRNQISITEALQEIPGLYINDAGGAAGLKTVSLRGMGSPHTAIYLDGVRIGNVQSGQTDLGMIDITNCNDIIIDYAQNSIFFNTAKPEFQSNRNIGADIKFRGGSFGTYVPKARLDYKITENMQMAANITGILSKGDFPYGDNGEKRTNNDISQIHTGVDFWGKLKDGNWQAKAYYNGSDRGTPGATTWPSTDRQQDNNALIQATINNKFTKLYELNASAKASHDDLKYQSSRYQQTDAQINTSHRFCVNNWFDASATADYSWIGLNSTEYSASRQTATAAATAMFHPNNIKADISLEYSGIFDNDGTSRNVLSPAIDLKWTTPYKLKLTAFGRRAYRTPTFNELYFPGYGNPELKAEDAWLTDIGLEYDIRTIITIKLKADGFYNYLTDKIISAPAADPYIWMPYNIGTVKMAGADAQATLSYSQNGWAASFTARYCYQNATDNTNTQIPYIAKHTAYINANASYKGWQIEISNNTHCERYDPTNKLPDYSTLDLTAQKAIKLPQNILLNLKFIARNLTDSRYELTNGYPMPGRAFYGEIEIRL